MDMLRIHTYIHVQNTCKVETIGDVYLVSSGCPSEYGCDDHAKVTDERLMRNIHKNIQHTYTCTPYTYIYIKKKDFMCLRAGHAKFNGYFQ